MLCTWEAHPINSIEIIINTTINIEGDVYDGDNFADKIAETLPRAINQAGQLGIANFRIGRGGIYDVWGE